MSSKHSFAPDHFPSSKPIGILISAVVLWCTLGGTATAQNRSPAELGTLAQLQDKDTVRALRLVTTGHVYSLGTVLGEKTPAYPGRSYHIFTFPVIMDSQQIIGSNRINGNDDFISAYLGVGTHIDGLGHVGINGQHYGGVPAAEVWGPTGLKKFGIHTLPPIVTRGVLLDIAALLRRDRLDDDYGITKNDIEQALSRQRIKIGKNDVLLLHTGWLSMASEDPARFLKSEPGLTAEAAEYVSSLGIVAVGADTWGVEVIPSSNHTEVFPVHQVLLPKHGVFIIENVVTQELARDAVYEFMFVLAVPRFEGAVQGPSHPIAIR